MGILDAPSIPKDSTGTRLASFAVAGTGTSAVRRLQASLLAGFSAVLGVCGDSTGNDVNEWVYVTGQQIGAAIPALRVRHKLWSDSGQNYGAWTTIQAGTTPATITDSFTRADASGTLGTTDTGQVWQNALGTGFSISGNKAVITASGGIAVLDTLARDYTGSIKMTPLANANIRVVLKYLYADTYIYANVFTDGAGTSALRLYRVSGGTTTQLAVDATTALSAGTQYVFSFTVDGPTITATINTKTVSTTLSLADQLLFRSTTSIGLASTADNSGVAFDDLAVSPAPQTVDIYNASTSGMTAAYSLQPRMALQFPVYPDQIVVNYGHNGTVTTFRTDYYALIRQIQDSYPRAALASTMQNARGAASPAYLDGIRKNLAIQHIAVSEGIPVINVMQAFLDHPGYAVDWLDQTDGLLLHPNTAGHLNGWVPQVIGLLFGRKPPAAPVEYVPRPTRVFISASAFTAVEGAPTLGTVSANSLAYTFDQTTVMSVLGNVDWPSSWSAVNIKVLWSTATGSGFTVSNNGCVWEATILPLNDQTAGTHGIWPAVAGTPTVTTVTGGASNSGVYSTYATTMNTALVLAGRPVALRIRRRAADAGDTLAENAYFLGVVIERAG